MTREILIGIVPTLAITWYIAQKIAIKKMAAYGKNQSLPNAGAYRTATTFKAIEKREAPMGVAGVKMKQPMKFQTKLVLALVWNSLFISGLSLVDGFLWPAWSYHFAFAAIVATMTLSLGSVLTSWVLVKNG